MRKSIIRVVSERDIKYNSNQILVSWKYNNIKSTWNVDISRIILKNSSINHFPMRFSLPPQRKKKDRFFFWRKKKTDSSTCRTQSNYSDIEGMFGLDPGDSCLGQEAPQAVGFDCLRWDVAAWAVTCLPGGNQTSPYLLENHLCIAYATRSPIIHPLAPYLSPGYNVKLLVRSSVAPGLAACEIHCYASF